MRGDVGLLETIKVTIRNTNGENRQKAWREKRRVSWGLKKVARDIRSEGMVAFGEGMLAAWVHAELSLREDRVVEDLLAFEIARIDAFELSTPLIAILSSRSG